jgi:Heterokaryon incompatibility protein (HET)
MVFQDAVRVCRRLGIRYLWIDSLCIIQDSKDDWELESSKICDYYENSYITISAASSPNGTVPFLVGRDRRWRPQRFELVCRNGEVASIFGRRHPGSSTVQLIEDSGPLASRAWVWQETTLSTRVLHYMESELIWECKSHICSEDGTTPRGLYSMRLTRQMLHCVESPYNVWHKLVETYSIRELSFETDRLPALSGTANRVNSITQSNYLAGIWKEALPLDLCWSVDRTASLSSEVKIPSSQYIAPSWAWSSVKGPIVFVDDSGFIPLATVKEADCTVPGLNPYGQVSDGFITLHGLLAYIRITCTDPQSWWAYTIGDDPETREPMTADCALVEAYGTAKRASETDELEAFSLLAPCILIGKDETEEDAFFHVLVLGKQGSGDQYIRVGYAPLDSDAWFEDAVEETIRIL